MSAPTSPSWYDVLGVEPGADAATIRTAWRDAIADLDPGQPRFRTLNQAAEILLDDEKRTSYDAELKRASEPESATTANPATAAPTRQKWLRKREPKAEPNVAISDGSGKAKRELSKTSATAPAPQSNPTTTLVADRPAEPAEPEQAPTPTSGPSTWLLLAVGLLAAVLVAGAALLATRPSDDAIASNTDDAQSAAEQAATTILAYDYRRLDADQKAADALMTPSYAAKYNALFAQIKANAATIQPVVTAQVLASGIVRSGDNRVQVLVFVNRPTTRADGKQEVFHDQVRMTMVESGGGWLVDCLQTGANDSC